MKENSPYKVIWRDHFHMDGWIEAPIIQSEVLVETVGFLKGEDENYIYLAQSQILDEEDDAESMMNVMAILKEQITEVASIEDVL